MVEPFSDTAYQMEEENGKSHYYGAPRMCMDNVRKCVAFQIGSKPIPPINYHT